MTPEQLQAWQPQASITQLHTFIKENATLFQLLEETWQKFNHSYHAPPALLDEAEDYPFIQQLAAVLPQKDTPPATTHETLCINPTESLVENIPNKTEASTAPLSSTLTLQKTTPLIIVNNETINEETDIPSVFNLENTSNKIQPFYPQTDNIHMESASSNTWQLQQEETYKHIQHEFPLPHTVTTEETDSSIELPSEIHTTPVIPPSDLAESTNMPIFPHTSQPTTITRSTLPIIPQLPNARVGENYDVALSIQSIQHIHSISFIPECGLTWETESARIMGIPTTHGEIEVQFLLHDNNNLTPIRQTLYINPNPQSLWQNIPSNPTTVFYKTDEACEEHPTPEGSLLAARVRGRSHAHVGSCCDDDFALQYHTTTHAHLLAVSDGAGSAAFSRLGSQLAVQTAINTLFHLLNDPDKSLHKLPHITEPETLERIVHNLFSQAVYDAYKAQYEAVQQHDLIPDVKSLSCTLLLALSLPLKNGQWLSAAYWVGDGAVALWQPEAQELALLGNTDSGTYSGETRFLNAEEASAEKIQQRVHIKLSHHAPIIILMTDGVSDPKFETDANLSKTEYWHNLWRELQAPLDEVDPALALQKWLGFWSAGNHDDRTLALFIPKITEYTPHTGTENT